MYNGFHIFENIRLLKIKRKWRFCERSGARVYYVHDRRSWAGINCRAHLAGQIYSNPVIRAYSYRCKSEKRVPNSYASFWKRDTSWAKKDRLHGSLCGLCWEWINVTLVKNRKTRGYVQQGEIERRKGDEEMAGQRMEMNKDGHCSMKHCNGPFGSKPLGFRTYSRASRYTQCTLVLTIVNY